MDPLHHCPSNTSNLHFAKASVLADVLLNVSFVEGGFSLRKVRKDAIQAAST